RLRARQRRRRSLRRRLRARRQRRRPQRRRLRARRRRLGRARRRRVAPPPAPTRQRRSVRRQRDMTTVAHAALPVASGLLLLGALARLAMRFKLGDEKLRSMAATYLVPLSNWCLIALGVYVFALVAAGRAGVFSLFIALALAGAAVLVQALAEHEA